MSLMAYRQYAINKLHYISVNGSIQSSSYVRLVNFTKLAKKFNIKVIRYNGGNVFGSI